MSLAPSHDHAMPAITGADQVAPRSMLAESAIAIAFLSMVLVAMMGWLYLLGLALWSGARWLLS